jgi:hypothetical protein
MTRVAIISLYMLRKGYMKHRIALFIVLMSLLGGIDLYFNQVYQPQRSVDATIASVNGGNDKAENVRIQQTILNEVNLGLGATGVLVGLACFAGPAVAALKKAKAI